VLVLSQLQSTNWSHPHDVLYEGRDALRPGFYGFLYRIPGVSQLIPMRIINVKRDTPSKVVIGGGNLRGLNAKLKWKGAELLEWVESGQRQPGQSSLYKFKFHAPPNELRNMTSRYITTSIPISVLAPRLTRPYLIDLCREHGLKFSTKDKVDALQQRLIMNQTCRTHVTVFAPIQESTTNKIAEQPSAQDNSENISDLWDECNILQSENAHFPPLPPTDDFQKRIINDFCKDTSPSTLSEKGCAVCGCLYPLSQLAPIARFESLLDVLHIPDRGITRQERATANDPIIEVPGPILDQNCKHICQDCADALKKRKMPKLALANGSWIGDVPDALQNLTYAERLLISRIFYSNFVIRVGAGQKKMKANVVMFEKPMPKIFHTLPPARAELDEVLAFIYIGPTKPTEEDYKRIPFLVRRNKVAIALEWLKLNHEDYKDLIISHKNLEEYPEDSPPVSVEYCKSDDGTKQQESSAKYDTEEEGVADGQCSFAVHGMTGEHLVGKSAQALKAMAIKHIESGGKMLAIGQAATPASMYNKPQLYPQIFPWLFPYGLGGFGNTRGLRNISDQQRKAQYLMYHDKRFQRDSTFTLLAFNHEQVKGGTTGGYLLAKRESFEGISNRLLNLSGEVLKDITERLSNGERVIPSTEEEKACFAVLKDIDHVASHVQGSLTQKKYMRNQVWSLISYLGAPSWFVTFSPADIKHPLCLYYADTKETFEIRINSYSDSEAYSLICDNPVAGARFFQVMVKLFIRHILGVDTDHGGIFGTTSGYYGTVEQQGRLTLHMHMLVWLKGALSPQEIRNRIIDPNSDFQRQMVEYLESMHSGEFINTTMEEMRQRKESEQNQGIDPTKTMPEPAPTCECTAEHTPQCACESASWWTRFKDTINSLLFRSNVHKCRVGRMPGACKVNSTDKCKGRFPRDTFLQTCVDMLSGAITMKKGEAFLNTFNHLITYLLRCNTDVTSLLSGTAMKAVVAYVTDYITKSPLKSHAIFDVIQMIYHRNSELLNGDVGQREKARKIITQVVNSLSAKMEIGAPMAAMYLLRHPDHYTSHLFKTFYWSSYVNEAMRPWRTGDTTAEGADNSRVILNKIGGSYVGLSPVFDYIYRSEALEKLTLYDWMRCAEKIKLRKGKKAQTSGDCEVDCDGESNDEAEEPGAQDTTMVEPSDHDDGQEISQKNCFAFLTNHNQHKTHAVHISPRNSRKVPTFIGNPPRSDQGNREYYCATMLTFFKPWRSGLDLKSSSETWSDSFDGYQFTPRQQEVMRFMNLKYECNDARDDFAAQRKRSNDRESALDFLQGNDILDELDLQRNDEQTLEDCMDIDFASVMHKALDQSEASTAMDRKMLEIETALRTAGWLDITEHDVMSTRTDEEFVTGLGRTAQEWQGLLTAARDHILQEKEEQAKQHGKSRTDGRQFSKNNKLANTVKIVNKSYLTKAFYAIKKDDQGMIDKIVKEFRLNTEQERAFRIICNHAVDPPGEQLKMYLSGMAGTGKSQVIKALTKFFNDRGEGYRLLIIAPTGGAAALVSGSTYHSVLGFNGFKINDSIKSLSEIRSRIELADFILLDEISMVDCRELFYISSQMSLAMDIKEEAFGGKNMIVAGDFAQLPPPGIGKRTLYTQVNSSSAHTTNSDLAQKSALGKAIWHQFTVVVILRKNMRQQQQSPEDAKFRTLLENLRYKACTDADIKFLKTRIAGRAAGKPKLTDPRFRYVSIITAFNHHRDRINQLGSIRFAKDHGRKLTTFYSRDTWKSVDDGGGKSRKKTIDPLRSSDKITQELQEKIWDIPPHKTENCAGKLDLCIGMPIMIKRNQATECAVTNGAEGTVAGWKSTNIGGRDVLHTLFVELTKPPKNIQLDGLPQNVVPIPCETKSIQVTLPNGMKMTISRQQTPALQNFAMTDYCSQGRTRNNNVVDLHNCKSHQSLYTCLSRSATAEGTVLVQGFDERKMKGGMSGYLRQEFRELEILNEITKLRYEGELPGEIVGETRLELIKNFREHKGNPYMPKELPKALKWSSHDPFDFSKDAGDLAPSRGRERKTEGARPVQQRKPEKLVEAKGTKRLHTMSNDNNTRLSKRRKLNPVAEKAQKEMQKTFADSVGSRKRSAVDEEFPPAKRRKQTNDILDKPSGFKWEAMSCAYDSLLSIIRQVWESHSKNYRTKFASENATLQVINAEFAKAARLDQSWEAARNNIRRSIIEHGGDTVDSYSCGTDIVRLSRFITEVRPHTIAELDECATCSLSSPSSSPTPGAMFWGCVQPPTSQSISQYLKDIWETSHNKQCVRCKSDSFTQKTQFMTAPPLLALEVMGVNNVEMDETLQINLANGTQKTFKLCGVIYYGSNHFNSRIVTVSGTVWYNDGIATGEACVYEGHISEWPWTRLRTCRGKSAIIVLYARDNL
jgi:hypothetical protein